MERLIECLFRADASVLPLTSSGQTLASILANKGDKFGPLLKQVLLKEKDERGRFLLHQLALGIVPHNLSDILSQGALEFQDEMGNTPLTYAAMMLDVDSFKLFITSGFDGLYHYNKEGFNVVNIIARHDDRNMTAEVLDFFYQRYPRENQELFGGVLSSFRPHGHMSLNTSEALLQLAIKTQTASLLVLGAHHGMDINVRDDEKGYTPLLFAAHKGDKNTLHELLALGGNANDVTAEGWSPLMLTINSSSSAQDALEMVHMLLSTGANPYYENADGLSAMKLAESKDKPDVLALLRVAMQDNDPQSQQRIEDNEWKEHQAKESERLRLEEEEERQREHELALMEEEKRALKDALVKNVQSKVSKKERVGEEAIDRESVPSRTPGWFFGLF